MIEKPEFRPEFYPNLIVSVTWLVSAIMMAIHIYLIVFSGFDQDSNEWHTVARVAAKASLILAGIGAAVLVAVPLAYRHTYRQRSQGFRKFLKDREAYMKARRKAART